MGCISPPALLLLERQEIKRTLFVLNRSMVAVAYLLSTVSVIICSSI